MHPHFQGEDFGPLLPSPPQKNPYRIGKIILVTQPLTNTLKPPLQKKKKKKKKS